MMPKKRCKQNEHNKLNLQDDYVKTNPQKHQKDFHSNYYFLNSDFQLLTVNTIYLFEYTCIAMIINRLLWLTLCDQVQNVFIKDRAGGLVECSALLSCPWLIARSGGRYQLRAPDRPGCFMDGRHMDWLHIGNCRNTDILNSLCFQQQQKSILNYPKSSG